MVTAIPVLRAWSAVVELEPSMASWTITGCPARRLREKSGGICKAAYARPLRISDSIAVTLSTRPTTLKVSVFTKRSTSWRLSTVCAWSNTMSPMFFTSVSSAKPKATIWIIGGISMKKSVVGSRSITMNSLNKIAPKPRKSFMRGLLLHVLP